MNPEAYDRIRDPGNVALLYHPETRRIGVKFPASSDKNYFPVRLYGRGGRMRIVRAGRLLKQFGIAVEKTLVFVNPETVMFQGSPMIVLELDTSQ